MNLKKLATTTLLAAASLLSTSLTHADRVRDYASFAGVRQNQLVGYGLVVGLDGTGDQMQQTPFAVQSTIAMLSKLGVNLPANASLQLKNLATVIVTADLPPFAKVGQPIDITVSSMGNAKSLKGGTLIATPLKGLNGDTFAVAQGNLVVAGAGGEAGGSKVQANHLNVGRIPGGATVERMLDASIGEDGVIRLELHRADFAMAGRLAQAINKEMPSIATAVDARSVEVKLPAAIHDRVVFLGQIENMPMDGLNYSAKVTINARTGSVVMNQAVRLEPCAVAHGGVTVQISDEPVVSQPAPLSNGRTVVADKAQIEVKQQGGAIISLPAGASLLDVVKSINTAGANPSDLIAILQAMKSVGALKAEIDVI